MTTKITHILGEPLELNSVELQLIDKFAMVALVGLLADTKEINCRDEAKKAYMLAAAMIERRKLLC